MMNQLNALHAYWVQRHWRAMRNQAEIRDGAVASAMDAVPQGLRNYWEVHGPAEFPGMPTTAKAWAWSLRGLLTYFALAASTPQQTLLPSRAADSVWHAWLAWDAEHLRRFQRRHFGKELPHVAKEDMPSGAALDTALPRTWGLASAAQGLPILSGEVPFLFTVDKVLGMPTGWAYIHNIRDRAIEVADIQTNGVSSSYRPAVGLTAAAFVGLGLLTADEALAWQQKNLDGGSSGSSGSSCGVGLHSYSCGSSSDGDGGGSDGGGDGGGCGGGCG